MPPRLAGKRYSPVGGCVYCGSKEKLTDEHVIPLGLNGDIVLPEASCTACNKITSAFEGSILKGDLKSLRAALSFKTRRPQEMPKTVPLLVTVNGQESTIQVPPSESLVELPFPVFEPPGFVIGRAPKRGIRTRAFVGVHFGPEPRTLLTKYGAEKIGVIVRVSPMPFARMLAKIAYCTVVGELGPDALATNVVLPAIRGQSEDLGSWVGTVGTATAPTPHTIQHSAIYSICEKMGRRILVVGIKLFSNTVAPAYLVIVGEPRQGLAIPKQENTAAV